MAGDFDVMKQIAKDNGPIYSVGLKNMIGMRRNKLGWIIEIGVSHEVGDKLDRDELVGALYLIDSKEFKKVKEIQAREVSKDA